jgi:hypothetical protein
MPGGESLIRASRANDRRVAARMSSARSTIPTAERSTPRATPAANQSVVRPEPPPPRLPPTLDDTVTSSFGDVTFVASSSRTVTPRRKVSA